MGQDLSRDETGKRGFALFSRTKYADRKLGVEFDNVKGEAAQRSRLSNGCP